MLIYAMFLKKTSQWVANEKKKLIFLLHKHFGYQFRMTISRLVTHCVHLNCDFVENYKHLFKFYSLFSISIE